MIIGVIRLEPDCFPDRGHGIVSLPLVLQCRAEAEVGVGVVGSESDSLTIRSDGLIVLFLPR
jgi:hypothetical protein